MVIGAVGREENPAVLHLLRDFTQRRNHGEFELIGELEPDELVVELDPSEKVCEVKAEMPEPADLERPRIEHAADVVEAVDFLHQTPPQDYNPHADIPRPWFPQLQRWLHPVGRPPR